MAKWYSIEKKLPKKGQHVLVTIVDPEALLGAPHFFDKFVSLAIYNGDKKFGIRESCIPYSVTVTHWKVLPNFPRVKINLPGWLKLILMLVGCTLTLGAVSYLSNGCAWQPNIKANIEDVSHPGN